MQLGKCLSVADTNKSKVILTTVMQEFVSFFVVGALALLTSKYFNIGVFAIAFVILAFLLALLPLRHITDRLEYYEYGLCFNDKIFLYDMVGEPQFVDIVGAGFDQTRMYLRGKTINVSYVKEPRKLYHQTYYRCAEN